MSVSGVAGPRNQKRRYINKLAALFSAPFRHLLLGIYWETFEIH